jgi:hypothetical protein
MPEERKELEKKEEKSKEIFKWNIRIDKDIIYFVILSLIVLFLFLYFNSFFGVFEKRLCGDGTSYGECSQNLPYFCMKGVLVQNAFFCQCPQNFSIKGDFCDSSYYVSPKVVTFNYILKGKYEKIDFTVYGGVVDYLDTKPQTSFYSKDKNYSLQDFKKKIIEEPQQRKVLLPLIAEIQNIAKNKDDQARIAISLVQNIPYEENANFDMKDPLSWDLKYPYDVLYQKKGLCGSKSDLLAFLLKELGYEVVIFHYYSENHEAVGIRCPNKYSLNNTGYCFIETTQPAIISYSGGEYSEQGKLLSSPEIIYISEGISLSRNLDEYRDARDFSKIYKASEKSGGKINLIEYYKYNQLSEKYGLVDHF